jgi:hypothetical protein
VSWVAAAIGVCVAAFYYALTLRETMRNRKATLANNMLQSFLSEEGALRWVDILSMQWSDFDDYVKKYDSSINRENFAKRITFWNTCEVLGYQVRYGMIDIETVYNVGCNWVVSAWMKFKPIIEQYRKWEWAEDACANFEYLANRLAEIQESRDKNYKQKFGVMIETHLSESK